MSADLDQFEQVVDHLLLEDRRPERGDRVRIGPVVVDELLLAARELAELRLQCTLHLGLGDLDLVLLADLGEHEAQPHAALGDLVVFRARLSSVVPSSSKVRPVWPISPTICAPDVVELLLDHLRRQLEGVHGIELVEQLALDLLAGLHAIAGLDLLADRVAELVEQFEAEPLGEFVIDLEGDRARPPP